MKINTVDLDSYCPGYDDYCESKEELNPDDNPEIDARVDEMIMERLEKEESE